MSTPRQIPDDLWSELEQLIPAAPSLAKGARGRADDRKLLDGRLHVLWTGCPWRALPRQVFGLFCIGQASPYLDIDSHSSKQYALISITKFDSEI